MAVPSHTHGDDGALVLAVQRGDVEAFDALFRRHYPSVRRACARRLVDPVEADEVAQAAFVRAFERIQQCSGPRRFGPWVHVIAKSLCMDAFRARARVEPFEQPLQDRAESRPNGPEESLLRDERAAHVHEALAALPERQRSAVIARDWEELRPGEIAERLGVSIGAVDSLLLRARRRMALSYRRLAGEAGGGAATRTLRGAVAAAGVALMAGPHAVMAASAAAAEAVQGTASRAAVGVVGAVVSVAASLGAPVPAQSPPEPPPAVVSVVQSGQAPAEAGGQPSVAVRGNTTPARPTPSVAVATPPPPSSPAAPTLSSELADPAAVAPTAADDPGAPAATGNATTAARDRLSATVPFPTTTTVPVTPPAAEVTADGPDPAPPVAPPPSVAAPTSTTVPVPVPAADPPSPTPPTTAVAPHQKPTDTTALPPVTTPSIPALSREVARS